MSVGLRCRRVVNGGHEGGWEVARSGCGAVRSNVTRLGKSAGAARVSLAMACLQRWRESSVGMNWVVWSCGRAGSRRGSSVAVSETGPSAWIGDHRLVAWVADSGVAWGGETARCQGREVRGRGALSGGGGHAREGSSTMAGSGNRSSPGRTCRGSARRVDQIGAGQRSSRGHAVSAGARGQGKPCLGMSSVRRAACALGCRACAEVRTVRWRVGRPAAGLVMSVWLATCSEGFACRQGRIARLRLVERGDLGLARRCGRVSPDAS